MRKVIIPPERKLNLSMVSFTGLSGIQIEVNTAHNTAGRRATLLTGEHIQVLGFVPANFFNTIAIRLADGRVTTVASSTLQFEE